MCHLKGHKEFNVSKEFKTNEDVKTLSTCVPCGRLIDVDIWRQSLGRFYMPSIIMIALILFLKLTIYYVLIPILAVIVIIPMFLSSSKISWYIHRNLPKEYKIAQMLKYADLRAPQYSQWYEKAYKSMLNVELNENLKIIVANRLVDDIVLSGKPNPRDLFNQWAKAFDMDIEEFVQYLFDHTNIMNGFRFDKGVSVLPDIWPYVSSETLKMQILDELVVSSKSLDEASETERQYFLEDLYLVEDDILDLIEEHGKWSRLKNLLDEFEPEVPPKNLFQQMRMQQEEAMRKHQLEKEYELKDQG